MFMTPLIFHAIDFSASQVGSGLAVAALIGTVVRLLSGALLDRGIRCSWPVRCTTLLAITADCVLIRADSYGGYVLGQLLLGCAAGLYWPAIELAVPLSCGSWISPSKFSLRPPKVSPPPAEPEIGTVANWTFSLRPNCTVIVT